MTPGWLRTLYLYGAIVFIIVINSEIWYFVEHNLNGVRIDSLGRTMMLTENVP
jgi:hypothetical protein